MVSKDISVNIGSGTDVGPVAELIQVASQFKSVIYVISDNKHVNAKSLMGMMTLGVAKGQQVCVTCEGEDEEEALSQIENFLSKED